MTPQLNTLSLEVEKNPTYLGYVQLSNELDAVKTTTNSPLFRVALLRNFTIEPFLPVLKGEFFLSGIQADFYIGDFDTIASDAMNPASGLYDYEPQLIIIAQWFELLSPSIANTFIKLSSEQREAEKNRIVRSLKDILHAIRKKTNAPVIINNYPQPAYTTLGVLDLHSAHSQKKWFQQTNNLLVELCSEIDNVFCIDLASVLAGVGYASGYNQRQWEIAKAPLSQKIMIPLAKEYASFLRALNGKSKKCLVLDCDGTLWGGVLGEDGPDGIKLGTTYPGSSYLHFQQQVLNLHDRGVILAICSKNNEEDIFDVLESNGNMMLKKHHLAAWQINWEDKASNILKIANELNIGTDSIVFADDNEFECDWIKSQLPEIQVVHLKGDPALFPHMLMSPGYFDALSFSEEDKRKTEMYISEKKRNDLLVSASSYENYLSELNIQAVIQKAQIQDLARISQLTQKTNQFNLTTKRYTESDIKNLAENEKSDIYTLKVSDKISDLGLIAVGIVRYDDEIVFVESFLMSCRALGRGLEDAFLIFMINEAKSKNKSKIAASYVPTKKNVQTKDFYKKNGFELVNKNGDATEWELAINKKDILAYPEWISVNNN